MFSDDLRSARVRIQEENPKKAGSKSYARFERYKAAQTIQGVLDLGGSRADIDWDIDHGYIVLLDRTLAPRKRAESESSESGGEDEQKRDTAARSLGGRKRHKPVSYAEEAHSEHESDDEYRLPAGGGGGKRARGSASSSKAHEPPALAGWLARYSFPPQPTDIAADLELTVNDEGSLRPPPPPRADDAPPKEALRVKGMPLVGSRGRARGAEARRAVSEAIAAAAPFELHLHSLVVDAALIAAVARSVDRGGRPLGALSLAFCDGLDPTAVQTLAALGGGGSQLARLDLRGALDPLAGAKAAYSRALEQAAGALPALAELALDGDGAAACVDEHALARVRARGVRVHVGPVTRRPTER